MIASRLAVTGILMLAIATPLLALDKSAFVRDIEHAKALEAQGKAAEALSFWERLRPKYAGEQGHYENELGNFYSKVRQYDKAEKAYLDGIALKGKYPRLYIGLALVYSDQSRYADAEQWAVRATSEFPNWWLGYHTLGEIARKQEDFRKATSWFRKALSTEPQAQTHWLLALTAYELKDWQSVVDSMQAAINLDRTLAGDRFGMPVAAISLAQLGRFKDAYAAVDTLRKNNSKLRENDIQQLRAHIRSLEQKKGG